MNKIINYIHSFIDKITLPEKYLDMIILSVLICILIKLGVKVLSLIYKKISKNSKYIFLFHQGLNTFGNISIVLILLIIWHQYLSDMLTIISFITAGLTIAIKEVILNIIGGLVIKYKKPFRLEDRISINNIKGDVVVIKLLSFKVLEVLDKEQGEQSSGIIVNIPNSFIFTYALKNYTIAFKYIWHEIVVKMPLDINIEKTKKELLKIVNSNEVVKNIPKKMDKAVDESNLEYRIYYNYLEPIIYTKVVDDHIEFNLRFLVHPKKLRNVEDDIWIKILEKNQENKIKLYQ